MNRILILVSLFCFSFGLKAQLIVEPLSTAKDTANGLIYILPKTLLNIEVDSKCTVEEPGPYFQYAERFLGTKDFIQERNVRYELTGFRMETKAIADTSQVYLISSGKKGKNLRFDWSSEGFLKSINSRESVSKATNSTPSRESASQVNPQAEWNSENSSIYTKEMQQAGSTAKMAELAANQLFAIREARFNILTQELEKTPSDGRSYEIVLSELNRMERYYLALFQGVRTVTSHTTHFAYHPTTDTSEVLFRFSSMIGVLDKANLGGEPYFLNIKRLPCAADSLKTDVSGKLTKGIFFRLPGKALIRLSTGRNELHSAVFTISQMGRVLSLPSSQFNSLELCPETGSLLRIER